MAKRYIKQFITQQLGQYLENLDSATDIQFSMSEAILQLENVTFREDALTKLKLPVQIKHGRVRKLDVRVPWRTISSTPVQITFDGIDLLLTPQSSEGWQFTDIYSQEYLIYVLQSMVQQILAEQATEAQQSWLDSIKLKVMDNIQVQITEVHIRMEHYIVSPGQEARQSASFGILLRSFDIHTTDKEGKEIFHDRTMTKTNIFKRVQLKGLALYLNPVDQNMIHRVSRHLLSQPAQVSQRMRDIIKQYVELTDCAEEDQHKVVDDPDLIYILRPLSLKIVIQNRTEKPEKLRVDITLTRFSLQFLYNQLKSILVFGKLAQQYRLKASEQEKSRKYRFLKKPDMTPRERWKFAIECILRSIRTKNGALTAFMIPEKKLVEYKSFFKPHFAAYYNAGDSSKAKFLQKMPPQVSQQFFQILSVLQPHQLKAWAKEVVSEIEREKKESKEAKAQQSWSSWLLGSSAKKQSAEQDEEDNLEKFFDITEAEKMAEADSISRRERTSLEVIFEVKELSFLLGKINQTKLDGIQMYNKGATIYLNGPTLNLDEFLLEITFQESGVNLVTIDMVSGQYQDCTSAIKQNKAFSHEFEKSRPQCTIELKKGTKELLAAGIEYDLNVRIESIIYKHYEDLIIRARAISNVKIDEEMQVAALGRLEDLREATGNRMHQLLYQTKNRYVISVESPVLILPICATFEGKVAPCWVMNTGNVLIISEDLDKNKKTQSIAELLQQQEEDRYDGYKLTISSIGLTYYDSFAEYEKTTAPEPDKPVLVYAGVVLPQMPAQQHEFTEEQKQFLAANPRTPQDTKKFQVLEDFEIRMLIKVLKKAKGSVAPKVIADVNTTPIQINFSVTTYNLLQNINYIFNISKQKHKEFTQEVDTYQLRVKTEIINKTILEGPIRRLNQTTLLWEDMFAVLSGRFLYLYESQTAKTHLDYIEIQEAEIASHQSYFAVTFNDVRHAIMPKDDAKWEESIRKQVLQLHVQNFEGNIEQQVNKRKQGILKKAQNPHQPASVMNYFVPSLKLQLKRLKVDANSKLVEPAHFENWVTIAFMGMQMNETSRSLDSERLIKFKEITLSDCTMPLIHQTLISQDSQRNEHSLEITMRTRKEGSPDFDGLLYEVEVVFKDVNFKFMPTSLNSLLKFLRYLNHNPEGQNLIKAEEVHLKNIFNLTDKDDKGLLSESRHDMDDAADASQPKDLPKSAQKQFYEFDCSCEKVQKSRYRFNASNMKMSLLHHKYTMELFRLDAESMQVEMGEWYDHGSFSTTMKQLRLYDVTNYPYTVSPKAYFDQVTKNIEPQKRAQNEMIRCNDFDFSYNSYHSAKCALKNPAYCNKLKMRMSPFRINYVQEVTMRFNEYLQQRFIDSLTMSDPYTNPQEEFEARQKRKGIPLDKINLQTDFGQDSTVNQMDIKIVKAEIFARDRPFSQNYILISSPQITLTSERVESKGRLLKHPDIVLGMQRYNIELKTINFWYGISKKRQDRLSLLKDTFTVKMTQDFLLQSEILQKIDVRQLETFQDIKIRFDPVMMVLPQAIYTYILRCNDLNFGWSDRLTSEFYCVKWIHMTDYYKNLKKVKSQQIQMDMPLLSLTLKHTDGSYIAELFLRSFNYNLTKFMDGASNQTIHCSEFYILDEKKDPLAKASDKQQAIVCPWDSKLEVLSKDLQKQKEVFSSEPQLSVSLKMKATGERKIVMNITGLKIFLKMPLFIMVQGYFNNAWPKYQAEDVDKPLGFVGNDPDNTARMIMSLKIHKSLICFLSRPGLKSIACQGEILFETMQENINRMKRCHSSLGGARHEFGERTMSLISDEETFSDTIYSTSIRVSQFVPYICSLSRLETGDADFSQINKRQLFSPLDLNMTQTYQLKPVPSNDNNADEETKWGVATSTKFEIGKLQLEISILDLHLILQVISHVADLFVMETIARLQAIESSIDQELMQRRTSEELRDNDMDAKLKSLESNESLQYRRKTLDQQKKQFFKKMIRQFDEDKIRQDSMQGIFTRLGQASAQFRRLTDGYTGQSFSQRETFLQFVKKDILQSEDNGEDIIVEDEYATEPQKPVRSETSQLLLSHQEPVYEEEDEPVSDNDSQEFYEVNEGSNTYNQLMESERKKSLSIAFNRLQSSSYTGGKQPSKEKDSLKVPTQTKSVSSRNSRSRRKSSTNSKGSAEESDDFKSLENSFDNYQKDVRSAYEEVFYSFQGKSRPQDNQQPAEADRYDTMANIEPAEESKDLESEDQSFDQSADSDDLGVQRPEQKIVRAESILAVQPTIQNVLEDNKDISCEQISILAINDYNCGFTPVLMCDLNAIRMTQVWKASKVGSLSLVLPDMLINYYNVELGEWEPLLEPTKMEVDQQSNEMQQHTKIVFEKPLNLNSTQECLKNLFFTYESWMQTPKYFTQDQAKRQTTDLNDLPQLQAHRSVEVEEIEEHVFVKRHLQTDKVFAQQMRESLISNQRPIFQESSQISDDDGEEGTPELKKKPSQQPFQGNNQTLVTPYSIANYTPRTVKIVRNGIQPGTFNSVRSYTQKAEQSARNANQSIYVLAPSSQTDYAVTQERLTDQVKDKEESKRTVDESMSMTMRVNQNQADMSYMTESHRSYTAADDLQDQNKLKHQEIIGIQFSDLDYAPKVDLNRNTGQNPWVHQITPPRVQDQLRLAHKMEMSAEEPLLSSYEEVKQSEAQDINLDQLTNKVFYGTLLKGMRKFLIIRAPFCFLNNTSYKYELRICDEATQVIKFHTVIPQEEFVGLDDAFFVNHTVQLRMICKDKQEQTLAQWSQSIQISTLVALPQGEGTGYFVTDNQVNSITTCIKRQPGEINGTSDLVLLPPLTIKNCLPCSLAVRKHQPKSSSSSRLSLMSPLDSSVNNDRVVEQSQEIQLHVFVPTKIAQNQEGFSLDIGVDGFVFTRLDLKENREANAYESDLELQDANGNTLKIGMRHSFSKAGFHLIFYAHVCLLVEAEKALSLMQIYYKGGLSQARRLLANSSELQARRYILCNKDTDIVVGIKDTQTAQRATSFSQNLDLSEPGKQTHFVIKNNPQPNQPNRTEAPQNRRYDFVCTPTIQLASYEDLVYTKLVQITPEYLICNQTKTSIEIDQDGHQQAGQSMVIEPGQKQEWYWTLGNIPDVNLRIVLRKLQPKPLLKAMRSSQEQIQEEANLLSESDRVSEWNWSRPISLVQLKDQSSFPLLICERQGYRKKNFIISKKVVGPIQFIIIKEENESDQPTYMIRNNCPNLQLSYTQDGVVMPDPWKLNELSQMAYAHMDPQARETAVTFNMKIDKQTKRWNFRAQNCFERQIQSVSLDNEWTQSFTYFDEQKKEQTIVVSLQNNGVHRTLTFELQGYEHKQHRPKQQKQVKKVDISEEPSNVTVSTVRQTTLSVLIHSMSLSMIGYTNTSLNQQGFKKYQTRRERNEIALFTVSGLNYLQKDDLAEGQQQINLEIVRFQIDNQSSQNPLFHTVLAKKDTSANSPPFLYFVVNQKTNQDAAIQSIDFFELQMADQVVKLDDTFLQNVLQTIQSAQALSQSNQTQVHPLFMIGNYYCKQGYLDRVFNPSSLQASVDLEAPRLQASQDLDGAAKSHRRCQMSRLVQQGIVTVSEVNFSQKIEDVSPMFCHWVMQDKVLMDSKKLELRDFKINKILLEFTFIFRTKHRRNQVDEGYLQYVQSSGFKLASVDELQLKFNEFHIQNRIIPQDDLTHQLNKFYIASIWSQIIESLFTIKALGNLTGFVGHVVDGCYDLVEMPRNGFQRSWYRGVGGIFQGLGSFMQKTGIGFFGSIEVFTESWSEIALAIGLDKDYAIMHEENVITERPKNFVEGLGFGARSFLQSIPAAAVGFFTRPVLEANKAGWIGLASGLYQGTVGILAKPVSGSLDLIAKTAEGVKNTLRIIEMKQKRGRVRMPRTFYGLQRRIKAFSEDDAFIVSNVLCQIKRGEFAQDHYIDMKLIWTSNDKNSPHFLLLSEENLFLIEASQKALVWHIESKHICKWTNMSNGMLISLDESKDYAGRAQVGLPLDTQSSQEINYWFEQVVQLKENF